MSELKVGDVVVLKSGGPLMTVKEVGSQVTVVYFDTGHIFSQIKLDEEVIDLVRKI